MSVTRYYQAPSDVMGFLSAFAGFGQEKRDVERVEAQMQQRADEQLFGGLGQGLGNIASSYASGKAQQKMADKSFTNQQALAMLANRNALKLDEARTQNNTQEYMNLRSIDAFGVPQADVMRMIESGNFPSFVPGGMDDGQQGPADYQFAPGAMGGGFDGGMSMDPQLGPEPNMTQAEEPPPPGYKRDYTPATRAAWARLDQERDRILSDQTKSKEEQYVGLMDLADQKRQLIKKSLLPDQPQPMFFGKNGQQMPMQLGENLTQDGGRILWDGQKQQYIAPTKNAEANQEYSAITADGRTVKYPKGSSVEVKPGLWQMTDTNGNTSMYEEKGGSGGGNDGIDITDFFKIERDLTKEAENDQGEKTSVVPNLTETKQQILSRQRAAIETNKDVQIIKQIAAKDHMTIGQEEYLGMLSKLLEYYGSREAIPSEVWGEYYDLGRRLRE